MEATKRCPYCGEEILATAIKCRYCGSNLVPIPQTPNTPVNAFAANDIFACDAQGKSRGVTALLALLLGGLGVHYFYLGKTTAGIIMLLLTLVSCGAISSIIALIQAILLFCMTNQEFENRYVQSTSTFPF